METSRVESNAYMDQSSVAFSMISGTKQIRNDMLEIDQDFLALGMKDNEHDNLN